MTLLCLHRFFDCLPYLRKKYGFLFFLILLSSMISAFFSLDAASYQRIFTHISSTKLNVFFEEIRGYEAFFLLSAKALNWAGSFVWFFLIAALSISLKWTLISRVSRSFEMSIAFYLAYFFILLDGTAIRIALAIAIGYWGLYLFYNDRKFVGIICVCAAFLFFHYSIAVLLLALSFRSIRLSYYIVASYVILVVFWFFGFTVLEVIGTSSSYAINSSWIGLYKLSNYIKQVDTNSAPYSIQFIFLFFVTLFVFHRFRNDLTTFEVVCFNCAFFSFFILAFLVGASAIQNRVSEIFRFSLVFIFPLYYQAVYDIVKTKQVAKILIYFSLIGYFSIYVVGAGLLIIPEEWL
jgi:hypothetical protein